MFKKKNKKNYPDDLVISIYFGAPGSGKSTYAAYIARKMVKKGITCYSNLPIKGTYKLVPRQDLGFYDTSDSCIIVDEASIEYNNRAWSKFKDNENEFFRYHRHYGTAIHFFSQSWDDIDLNLRRLAQNIFWVKRSLLPWFIYLVPVKKTYDILDGQIIDSYVIKPHLRKYIFCPPYWKMFNSYSRKEMPIKDFETWG